MMFCMISSLLKHSNKMVLQKERIELFEKWHASEYKSNVTKHFWEKQYTQHAIFKLGSTLDYFWIRISMNCGRVENHTFHIFTNLVAHVTFILNTKGSLRKFDSKSQKKEKLLGIFWKVWFRLDGFHKKKLNLSNPIKCTMDHIEWFNY